MQYHHFYHVAGKTNLDKMQEEARAHAIKGSNCKVHFHSINGECNDKCATYLSDPEGKKL